MAVSINKASAELSRLEAEIERHWKSWNEVGDVLDRLGREKVQAHRRVGELLEQIRQGELYKPIYRSWQSYVEQRWKISKQHANRLRVYVEVVADMMGSEPHGSDPVPTEAQARKAAELPKDQRGPAWKKATEGGKNPSAKDFGIIVNLTKKQTETGKPAKVAQSEDDGFEKKGPEDQLEELEQEGSATDADYEVERVRQLMDELARTLNKAMRLAKDIGESADDVLEAIKLAVERLAEAAAA